MGPIVLVTGASSGIGLATARLLAQQGSTVYGACRNPPENETAVRWVRMDVRDERQVRKGVEEIVAAAGPIDALVCNAGFGIFGSVEEVDLVRARAQFETNVFGTLAPLRAVLPSMRERRRGRVVVVGSLAGRAPIPFQAHYSATKAALDALTLALRNEVMPFGVSVSLVEPGDIRTGFNDTLDWGSDSSHYGDRIRSCRQVILESLPRAPGPEVVARTIQRALSARSPRVRYTVGPDSMLVPFGRRLLPDWLSLYLIRDHFKI
jgi:NAD(P)-dependent dehydrogenase (short-subunit alcohol dehydrogenase family)